MLDHKLRTLVSRFDFSRFILHKNLREAEHADLFRARILVGVCAIFCLFVPAIYFSTMSNFGANFTATTVGFIIQLLGPILSLLVLRYHGSLSLASWCLVIPTLCGFIYFACVEGVSVGGTYFWFAGTGLLGIYLFGLNLGKYWCALCLFCQVSLIHYFRTNVRIVPVGMSHSDFVGMFAGDAVGVTIGIWTIAALYEFQRRRFEIELQSAQKELFKHRENLMKGARLTELGQMAGGVAHEINNPLAIVHGYNIRLRREFEALKPLTEEQEKMFFNIDRSCLRIATISRSLLSYAHEGSFEQDVVFSLQELQDEFMVLCHERMQSRNIRLTVECPNFNQILTGKYVKLLQVIVNLLNNAIDAVSTVADKWIKLSLAPEGSSLHIEIVDSGEGIPETIRDQIKSPFFTTKPVGKGTGLGLSIVDGIIRDINGQFYLDPDSPNTRFVVSFPLERIENQSP